MVAAGTGSLFASAGLLVAVATVLDPVGFGHVGAIRGLTALAVCVGVVSMLAGPRLPYWAAHVFLALGTGIIALGVELTGSPAYAAALAFLMVLIAVDSAVFFAWPPALAHLTAAVSASTWTLTGPGRPGSAVALLVAGSAVLVAAVVAWLVRAASAAESDPLTGLVNRRGLDRVLDEAIAHGEQSGRPLSVAVIDVDDFKQVNDREGHRGGDQLLAQLARTWAPLLPEGGTLGRLGGDEFVVVLPGRALPVAVGELQRLHAATPRPHTVSIGVAQWDPDSPSTLMTDADRALYEAKQSGRNRVRHHGSGAAARREIRAALTGGRLRVHHQPVVALDSGRTVGTEALLRWQHQERGLLAPAAFLPLIEGTEMMVEVGTFVLDQACAQTARWRVTGGPATVAVNVTGVELGQPGYVDQVTGVLTRHGLPASALILEVTESSLEAETTGSLRALERLRALGVRIAVDDFGTGYSSLARLTRLPVDILKIDQSFVRDIGRSTHSAPLIQVILALAAALRLDVIAEGVEQPYQAELLHDLGCPHAQGYLFGRPVPAEHIELSPTADAGADPRQTRMSRSL